MLSGVDRSILQFDTAAQLIAPVKHMCFTKNQWLVATAQFGRRQSFFFGDAHGHGHAHASIAIGTH